MRKIGKLVISLAALAVMAFTTQAALLVYEGFDYLTGTTVLSGNLIGGIGLDGAWVSTDTDASDANYEVTDDATAWGTLGQSGKRLKRVATGGVEAVSRSVSNTVDLAASTELWFSMLYDAASNSGFAIATDTLQDDQTPKLSVAGDGFGFTHKKTTFKATTWDGATTGVDSSTSLTTNGELMFIVGKIQFDAGVGGADIYTLYSVGQDLVLGDPIATMEVDVDQTALDVVAFTTNRGPKWDEFRIGETYNDVIAVSSEFSFDLTPADTKTISTTYPAVTATNSIVAQFVNSTLGVEVVALNITGGSGAFTALTSAPFTMTDPAPTTVDLEFEYDATVITNITGATPGFNTNCLVDVVWKNLDDDVLQTNTISLVGKFSNPVFQFSIDSGLGLTLVAPETTVSNNLTVSYVEGRPGQTNVEIFAVNVIDASTNGFSAINPGIIPNPEPSNAVITVIFDNSGGQLANKEGATANLEVIWGEVGSSITSTSMVPVSAYNYNLASGVIQQVFGVPVDIQLDVGAGAIALNNFGAYTNQWNADASLLQDTAAGCIKLSSGGNTRSAFNLIEANTAGSDNFGAADTQILTNGLYRYDFDYEILNTDGTNIIWSFGAYALINQGEFSTNDNPDKVTIDLATGTAGGVDIDMSTDGIATFDQHPNGTLDGTNDVARSSSSVYLNVQDGEDALFVMHRSGKCTVRLYDLVLTRVGDYDPNTEANSANAVIAATFDSIASTNSIVTDLTHTDTNTNGIENTWRGNNVEWNSQMFKTLVNDSATRVAAIITRSGTSGYDDVGVQDTIALTEGTYDLTMDVEIAGSFPTNSSVARIEVYALSQDATGDINQVSIKHSDISPDYVIATGSAGVSLLASKEYSANVTETLSFADMTVWDGQDVAIVFYNQDGPDTIVDNVELVRTGDVQLAGYDGWAQQFDGFYDTAADSDPDDDGINNLLEYALNGDPTVAGFSILPDSHIAVAEGTNYLYYIHTERTDDGTLTYTVQAASDLMTPDWDTAGIEFVGESAVLENYKSVTNRTDADMVSEFIRLQVQQD